MSTEESQDTDCELPEDEEHNSVATAEVAQLTSSPVTSLPDVVTASHAQATASSPAAVTANQVQSSSTNQQQSPISQSVSHPESLSLALSSSQPASPRKHLVVVSGSNPSSPQRQPANIDKTVQGQPGSPLRNQPKGQIGFTIDFDDTGVSWNLKSDLNQFLPSSRKLRMEGRRTAAKESLPSRKQQSTRSLSPRERVNSEIEPEAQPSNDKDDLLSEAGTYIIDNVPGSKPQLTVAPKPRPKNLSGDFVDTELNDGSILHGQKFVDIETHDFTIGQSSLMESFLDHAAAAAAVNVSTETLGNSRINVNEIEKMSEAITPVASDDDCEKKQNSDKQKENDVKLNQEVGGDKFATFSRGRKTVSVQPRVRATAIPCRSNDITPAKEQSNDFFEKSGSKQRSERSKSPQYTSSLTSSSIVSSKVSSINKTTMESSKGKTVEKKGEKSKSGGRGISNLSIRRPSSANAGKLKPKKVDVDKRLVEMEEALKKNLKVSVGKNVLAQYSTDNSSPARANTQPPQPKTTGNFTRATPVRRSAGPILTGSKQKQSDINSLSSGSDVFEDKKSVPSKPSGTTRNIGPPPSPTASVRMNKAMKLRMKKFSDCEDMDCLSMTSDGASSKSMSNSKKLTFSRANPLYKSLPGNRAQVGTLGNQTSRAVMAAKVAKPVILPNKTTIGAPSKSVNTTSGMNRNAVKLQVHNKASEAGLRTNSSGSRTPDETNLSTFDKLVLSSIDQLSKKLNINSSLLVNLCQQHDSQLTGLKDLTNIAAGRLGKNHKGDNNGCDIPKLKTGCQEISAILYELRVVEKNIDHVTRHLNTVTSNKCNESFSQSLDNSFNSGNGGANIDMCDLVEYF